MQLGRSKPFARSVVVIQLPPRLPQVQSQDIAVTFLARLVFEQRSIAADFLERVEVADMLRCAAGERWRVA